MWGPEGSGPHIAHMIRKEREPVPWGYIAKRLATGVVQLLGVTLAVFFLIRLLPADPVARLVGFNASDVVYDQARASLGLDQPVLRQLGLFLGFFPSDQSGLLQGDLGKSWVTNESIISEILHFFPITLELITISFMVAILIAIPIGMISAFRPNGRVNRVTFVYGLFAGAQPEFWWGLVFIYVFFFRLGWAPAPLGRLRPLTDAPDSVTGFLTIDSLLAGRLDVFFESLYHLWLPVMTLVLILSGPIIKMIRQNMLRVLESDFILYARASGLPSRTIATYTFRSAFAPTLTLLGILYGFMLGGAVLVEQVFSIGGLGQYSVRSILQFDYPAIQGVVLVITAFSLLVYLALDVIHAVLDPRVRR